MILHLFCQSYVCNLILTHIRDAFGFSPEISCDILTTYRQGHSVVFAVANLRNKFVMATKVLVNRDRGLASLFKSKILLL
jgi:hypothetical protein